MSVTEHSIREVSKVGGILPKTKAQEKILAFCNRLRSKAGQRPRRFLSKGVREDPWGCTIANTIAYGTNMDICASVFDTINFSIEHPTHLPCSPPHIVNVEVKTPKYVATFMTKFDEGDIPELVR